jgi:hypothetical protein
MSLTTLLPINRKATSITVEGMGAFPIDMLRYDACYPASERDAATIITSFEGAPIVSRVRLTLSFKGRYTPDRWRSFLWNVVAPLA